MSNKHTVAVQNNNIYTIHVQTNYQQIEASKSLSKPKNKYKQEPILNEFIYIALY